MSKGLTSSGLKSSSAVIAAMPAQLFNVQLLGDGTNAAVLTVYDNASAASGTVLAKLRLDAGLVQAEHLISEHSIVANQGIYCEVSGTGAEYIVHFCLGA